MRFFRIRRKPEPVDPRVDDNFARRDLFVQVGEKWYPHEHADGSFHWNRVENVAKFA